MAVGARLGTGCPGSAGRVPARHGRIGEARPSGAGRGWASPGLARHGRHGRIGAAGRGMAGCGMARHGLARHGRIGRAGHGAGRRGKAWQATNRNGNE